MEDLNKMMSTELKKISDSGFIEEALKKQLEKTISSAISDIFNEWSDFGKNLQKNIKNQLQVDFSDLGLAKYSSTITTMVRGVIQEKMDNDAKKEAMRFLDSIDSHDIKPEMKITEIVQKIVEIWKDDDPDSKHEGFEFSFHFTQRWPNDSGSLKNYYNIYIDKEGDLEPKECSIVLDYNLERQEIDDISFETKRMKETTFYTTKKWNVEGFLFRLYSAKSKIINDSDNVEIYVDSESEY